MGWLKDTLDRWERGAQQQQARRAPVDAFDVAQLRAQAGTGVTDSTRPTLDQVRDYNRGLFATLVRMRADAIGTAIADAVVVRHVQQGETEPVEVLHPWPRLLRRPNGNRAALNVWRWASIVRDFTGSSDFLVEYDGLRIPKAIHEVWPVFGKMQPVPDGMGGVKAWKFNREDGKVIDLEARDVIRLQHPDPVSAYETMGLMERAGFELDKSMYADIYERDQLKEGRVPPIALTTDQELTQTQLNMIRDTFKSQYMTPGNVKGIPVLSNGLKASPITASAADLGLIDSRKLSDTHLFWMLGIPQGLMSDAANRANADAARYIFAQQTVQPEVDSICAQLTIEFERIFGADAGVLQIVAPDVVPIDDEQQSRIDERHIRSGLRSIDELRARDGQPDLPGTAGRRYYIPGTLVPIEETAASDPAPKRSFMQPAA